MTDLKKFSDQVNGNSGLYENEDLTGEGLDNDENNMNSSDDDEKTIKDDDEENSNDGNDPKNILNFKHELSVQESINETSESYLKEFMSEASLSKSVEVFCLLLLKNLEVENAEFKIIKKNNTFFFQIYNGTIFGETQKSIYNDNIVKLLEIVKELTIGKDGDKFSVKNDAVLEFVAHQFLNGKAEQIIGYPDEGKKKPVFDSEESRKLLNNL